MDERLHGMPFAAVLWDFDGLIADTETTWYETWRDAFARHGGDLPLSSYAACVGTVGMEPEADLAALVGAEAMPELLAEMDVDALTRSRQLPPMPGVVDLLADTDRAGVPRAIVTSSPRRWIEDMLAALDLDRGWAALICADGDRHIAKPSPHLYRTALERLEAAPGRALALEDSPTGVRAAKAAGLRCVAVPNRITRELDLSEADLTLSSLEGVTLEGLLTRLG